MEKLRSLIMVVFGVTCLCSCGDNNSDSAEINKINVVKAEKSDENHNRSYSFISQPYRVTDLSFRVGGPVSNFEVQSGSFFRKGDMIAAIDNRDFLITKERAESELFQKEADWKRISSLYEKDNISEMNYIKSKTDFERAKANYQDAVNALNDTRLYAPFDGYVQSVNIEKFQEVSPAYPVLTFIDISKIKIEAYIPEEVAIGFSRDKNIECKVKFNSISDREFYPSDVYVSQSTSDNNISYLLTVILDNKDNSLIGGMTGTLIVSHLTFSSNSSVACVVPRAIVCNSVETGEYVWTVKKENNDEENNDEGNNDEENYVVSRCPVKTGRILKGDMVEIISGIDAGDMVASTGLYSLTDGEKVDLY